jgi:NhaA family Na+:H+ antiporter
VGKPLGIGLMTYIGALLMKAQRPGTWLQVVGVGCIAGVGFTMSLFVGALAFTDPALATPVRLGVYAGSIFSALLGLAILSKSLPRATSVRTHGTSDPTHPFMAAEPEYEAHDNAKP